MKKLMIGAIVLSAPLAALAAPSATDWVAYGHDASGGRFSPLTQITPDNVGQLQLAWTYHMNPTPQTKTSGRLPTSTTTPLMVNNTIYLGTPYGRVVALDADTGKELWAYQLPGSDQPPFRGLTYWPGDGALAPRSFSAARKAG